MSVALSCEPCIDRKAYTVRAVVHGTTDDAFWTKLTASARQSARDMRVRLDWRLHPPGEYDAHARMARDIREAAAGDSGVDALIVTIPALDVATAVRYAADAGMPVFGLNSGYEEVSGSGGLVEDGSVLFFTAMNERLGGEAAAEYFLQKFGGATIDEGGEAGKNLFEVGEGKNSTAAKAPSAPQSEMSEGSLNVSSTASNARQANPNGQYAKALFVSPLGEENSAYDQRFEGYRDRLLMASNNTDVPIAVDWFQVDASSNESQEQGLRERLSDCSYQSVLVGTGRLAADVNAALRSGGCHESETPTLMGTFDTPADIFDLIAAQQVEFAIGQQNHMQGWSPVHFAALYVSTGLVLAPPPGGVYLSGPALFARESPIADTLRVCTEDAFPICPNAMGPDGEASDCPCTERSKMVIGGVTHGITTDTFWDAVYAAAEQGAADMGVELAFDRFEPQASQEILYRKMSAKILSLCQGGVDGLFATLSDPIIVDAVKACQELNVPVMSVNAGIAASAELGLIHHVGMVEENAGYQAGKKMASMAMFNKAHCLNHFPGLTVTKDRCIGFGKALGELGIEYLGQVDVPDDNVARFVSTLEGAVGDTVNWEGLGLLLCGAAALPGLLEVKKAHPAVPLASFDTSNLLYEALASGDLLFGIDQQPYMQGYSPLPILTHKAMSKQNFRNHAIESGPSFVLSPPSAAEKACQSGIFAVCPDFPEENYNYVNEGLIILGLIFFCLQAAASAGFLGWMARFRNAAVIKASQPEFLSLVAIGCLMLASAIVPLSIQGGYRFERDAITLEETEIINEDISKVDSACMASCSLLLIAAAVPWLICIGFVLTYSALVAKLRRLEEIMKRAQNFSRAEVPTKKVLRTVAVLLLIMVAILLTWQFVSPLQWSRDVTETDFATGYPTGSFGRCTSEHAGAFVGTCAAFLGFCLAYALVLAYRTRAYPTEWAESKYIAASVFFLLQLLVLGVPILVIASENSDSYYMVMTLILWLASFGTTLLIFVPKVIAHKKSENQRMSMLMMRAVQSHQNATGRIGSVEEIRRRVSSREMDGIAEGDDDVETIGEEAERATKLAEKDELDRQIATKRKVLEELERERMEREGTHSGQQKAANGTRTRSVSFSDNIVEGTEET